MGVSEAASDVGAEVVGTLGRSIVGRSFLQGLIFALVLTFIVHFCAVGFSSFLAKPEHPMEMLVVLCASFVIIGGLAYWGGVKEQNLRAVNEGQKTQDLLTPFRNSLAGPWSMEFGRFTYDNNGSKIFGRDNSLVEFSVDGHTGKLIIEMRIKTGGGYLSDDIRIDSISIRPAVGSPNTLDYYHAMSLTGMGGAIVNGEIFAHLSILYKDEKVDRLEGVWYDLQGRFASARKAMQRGTVEDLPTWGSIKFTRYQIQHAIVPQHGSFGESARPEAAI